MKTEKFNPPAKRKSVLRNTNLMMTLAAGLAKFGIPLITPVGDLLGTTSTKPEKERHAPNGGRHYPRAKPMYSSRCKSRKVRRSKIRMRSHRRGE